MTTKIAVRPGWLAVLATSLALLLLGGCSAGSASQVEPADAPAQPGEAVPDAGGAPEAPTVPGNRQIARSAAVMLVVADVERTAGELRRVATLMGGMVTSEALQLRTGDEAGDDLSRLVVTVPTARLDETLTLIAGLGEVSERTVESVDVTDAVVDVDSRVKTLRDSIARLQALMERAGSVSDIAAVEAELTSRQAELEAMLARQQALREQVASSPVTVTLSTEVVTEPERPRGFLSGLASGWAAMLASAEVGLTVVGALLPWLVLAAVVAAPLWWWRRRRTRAATLGSPGRPTPASGPGGSAEG